MQNSSSNKSNGLLGIFSLCEEMLFNRGTTFWGERRQTWEKQTTFVFIRLSLYGTK